MSATRPVTFTFTEKSIGVGEWERRCGLIRWSLVSDSIPDGQDSTSASSWFKEIMEDDDRPGGRVFTSFVDFRDKFEKRWITGTRWRKLRTSSGASPRIRRRQSVSTQSALCGRTVVSCDWV